MKALLSALVCWGVVAWSAGAATTINPANRFAYGANIGWVDWHADGANGAVIGEFVCSGFLWSGNVGWINLGDGLPPNGIRYQNTTAANYGVNHDGLGNLRGLAWGANIGWLNFEASGNPRVDLRTGILSGFVWGANVGWISLSNAFAYVQTDTIRRGLDSDGDGIADAWERLIFGNLAAANAVSDADGDGFSDLREYLADTDPLDPLSSLRIVGYAIPPGGSPVTLTWTSRPSRWYYIDETANLLPVVVWSDSGLGLINPDPGPTTTRTFADAPSPQRYFQVRVVFPLSP